MYLSHNPKKNDIETCPKNVHTLATKAEATYEKKKKQVRMQSQRSQTSRNHCQHP